MKKLPHHPILIPFSHSSFKRDSFLLPLSIVFFFPSLSLSEKESPSFFSWREWKRKARKRREEEKERNILSLNLQIIINRQWDEIEMSFSFFFFPFSFFLYFSPVFFIFLNLFSHFLSSQFFPHHPIHKLSPSSSSSSSFSFLFFLSSLLLSQSLSLFSLPKVKRWTWLSHFSLWYFISLPSSPSLSSFSLLSFSVFFLSVSDSHSSRGTLLLSLPNFVPLPDLFSLCFLSFSSSSSSLSFPSSSPLWDFLPLFNFLPPLLSNFTLFLYHFLSLSLHAWKYYVREREGERKRRFQSWSLTLHFYLLE